MKTINELLETINTSKMERGYVDISDMCENQFDIFEYIEQPQDSVRLTYCYYESWICTDSRVGLKVWYFDDEPVCISYKFSRKGYVDYVWLSKEDFHKVRNYIHSLKYQENRYDILILNDQYVNELFCKMENVEYKTFVEQNIKN